jgi:hypothetical protein
MKKSRQQPMQRTLDEFIPRVSKVEKGSNVLAGEPFISPIARIPTNRSQLVPAAKSR